MNKKKLLVLLMSLVMVATIAIGTTLAYFTDTDSATNVFTVGNVEIDLNEVVAEKNENGDLVATGERQDVLDDEEDEYDYGKVYPGQFIDKDPTIENLGSEDAYIAAIVTVTSAGNLHTYGTDEEGNPLYLLGLSEDYANIDIAKMVQLSKDSEPVKLVSGGEGTLVNEAVTQINGYNGLMAFEGETYYVYQQPNKADNTYVFYFIIKEPLVTDESVTLFHRLNFDYRWDNEEMAQFENLNITVDAYAVQAYGFDDETDLEKACVDAMLAAFPEAFGYFQQ